MAAEVLWLPFCKCKVYTTARIWKAASKHVPAVPKISQSALTARWGFAATVQVGKNYERYP